MADPNGTDGAPETGSYELQVYALSPVAPSPQRLIAEAEGGGLPIRLVESDGKGPDGEGWTRLVLEAEAAPGARVEITTPDALASQLEAFREDAGAGEEIPEALFDARRLFLVELPDDGEGGAGESDEEDAGAEAVFVLSAWALAALTEGLVFDPQEEIFADAESFLALLMDEEAAEAPGLAEN